MKDELSEEQANAILKALDDAIEQGPWEESNFLRVIGKNLREIREHFASQVQTSGQGKEKIASHLANRIALRSGQREIFVALYSSSGSSLSSWERIITNLPGQMISRPIYANEKDVKEIIGTKENKVNEGYVSIYVSQTDILPTSPEKTPTDKLGKPLLTLKDRALKLENLNRFIHMTGTYKYVGGRLVKISNHELEKPA
ncbi:Dot/Icm secretion system protein IcmQ [Legionella oakridgensis]|uniref:Dot/Icm secretion system protein ImcQ n=3 Tax=Legionella oakridgensis TaxID=29423 RepID=W0BBK7_9GAMM|nr:Dot/Icm secretion system protein IcmQ [Legionella oakridgensis]AAX56141.1 IcmQ [Legionella oakridgensis]AHE67908.1 Dot/Icm secretion system protein ImcQ [Legionella oakridgensis ATCC 33761 = DSM 21215]